MDNNNITAGGNILAHYREDVVIPIAYYDDDSNQIDLSTSSLFLEVDSVLRKPLLENPDDASGKLLILSRQELRNIPKLGANFIVVDETIPNRAIIMWEGRIIPRGWIDAS